MNSVRKQQVLVSHFLLGALTCLLLGASIGVLSVVFYSRETAGTVFGLSFQQLQPLHTLFGVCWIYLAGVATIYHFLFGRLSAPSDSFFLRARWGLRLWMIAGVITVLMILFGRFTGREYLPFHPAASLLVLAGWICLAINLMSVIWRGFSHAPSYVWMWGVSMALFVWTFIEAHLYLLPAIGHRPLVDLAVQWKSYGALVGSFNLIVYGGALYVGTQLSGCEKYARSPMAFALFFIGIINSFTNYGHHTYHVPQSHFVKWFSFIVSMLEIVIWLKVSLDILRASRQWRLTDKQQVTRRLFIFANLWTFVQLGLAIIISIPPLNTLIHGTHVVSAHAMGSMIGIDSMILWGCGFFLLSWLNPTRITNYRWICGSVMILNIALVIFWLTLMTKGVMFGWRRYTGSSPALFDTIEGWFPVSFLVTGTTVFLAVVMMLMPWISELFHEWFQTHEPQQSVSATINSHGHKKRYCE